MVQGSLNQNITFLDEVHTGSLKPPIKSVKFLLVIIKDLSASGRGSPYLKSFMNIVFQLCITRCLFQSMFPYLYSTLLLQRQWYIEHCSSSPRQVTLGVKCHRRQILCVMTERNVTQKHRGSHCDSRCTLMVVRTLVKHYAGNPQSDGYHPLAALSCDKATNYIHGWQLIEC